MNSTYDVVIVGAGMAGLMCAYYCVQADLSVAIVHHGDVEHSSSSYAQGGIAASWSDDDSTDRHASDTISAGAGLCIKDVVDMFTQKSTNMIQLLIDLGVPFDRDNQQDFCLAKEGAHSCSRIFYVKDFTGQAIVKTLLNHLHNHELITWVNATLDGLSKQDSNGRINGVFANEQIYYGSHVVLATGGFSGLFRESTNPKGNMGQGIALAYGVGAQLGDLEFIQYHPTVYCKKGFPPLLISEALRGEGAFLVNKNQDRFMENYHPLLDLAPRDIVARAIVQESEPALNIAPLMTQIEFRFPTIFQQLLNRGFTTDQYLIPVQPLAHYTIGGIVTNMAGQTSVSGLYAIGECAVTGFHGANRLASNSLLEAGVMGQECAQLIIDSGECDIDPADSRVLIMNPLQVEQINWLGQLCRDALGVIRSQDQLISAIHSLNNQSFVQHTMVDFVRAIIASALHRLESRGGHYRVDAPDLADDALHSMIKKGQEVIHKSSFLKNPSSMV